MVKIVIKDLDVSKELDKKAMNELVGGSKKRTSSVQSGAWKAKKYSWLERSR